MNIKVLITGASPDIVNNNAVMRNYVAEGFSSILPQDNVRNIPLQFAVKELGSWPVDLIVVFGSCMPDGCYYGELKRAALNQGAKLAFWLHDDPYEQDFNYKVTSVADYIFSNDKWATQFYDHDHCYHLPMAASKSAHYREVRSEWVKDVFFCGVAFDNRIQLLRDIAPLLKKLKSNINGDGWPKDLPFCQNKRIGNSQLPDYLNNSKFTLNIGRHLSLGNDRFKLDPSTPGPRTFETAMAGSVQLFFVESLEIEDYYKPDEEILLFDSYNDLSNIFERYMDDKDSIMKIAKKSQCKTLEFHMYKHRAKSMLDIIYS
ncbi:glycosyltransferase [Vibrio fluvialis]|nr:glycosyltransferase [Vibrio fluvialis]